MSIFRLTKTISWVKIHSNTEFHVLKLSIFINYLSKMEMTARSALKLTRFTMSHSDLLGKCFYPIRYGCLYRYCLTQVSLVN